MIAEFKGLDVTVWRLKLVVDMTITLEKGGDEPVQTLSHRDFQFRLLNQLENTNR